MTGPGSYYQLSYAHSAPMLAVPADDPDERVGQFYHDLDEAVGRAAGRSAAGGHLGGFDRQIPAAADCRDEQARRIATAQVFVPLLSPLYLTRSWAQAEYAAFRTRVRTAGAACASTHLQPVLWVGLPREPADPELRQALALAPDIDGYEEGLWAMCGLRVYRREYLAVLRRLADRIVEIAERHPIGAADAAGLAVTGPSDGTFVVAVAAPPGGRPAGPPGPGDRDGGWMPYEGQALPIAGYAANAAERLGLSAVVGELTAAGAMPHPGAGLVLVDLRLAADASGRQALAAVAGGLPPWVAVTVVVGDDGNPDESGRLAGAVVDLLLHAGVGRCQAVRSLEEFVRSIPATVLTMQHRFVQPFPSRGPQTINPWARG